MSEKQKWALGIAVPVLGLLSWLVWAGATHRAYLAARQPSNDAIATLDALARREHDAMKSPPEQPLAEACAGKLTSGAPSSALSWWGTIPKELEGARADWPNDKLLGYDDSPSEYGPQFVNLPFNPDSDDTAFEDWLLLRPSDWEARTRNVAPSRPPATKARYLFVHHVGEVTFPKYEGEDHVVDDLAKTGKMELPGEVVLVPGHADLHVRVLEVPAGKMVCEGLLRVEPHTRVTGHGKGKTSDDAAQDARVKIITGLLPAFAQAVETASLLELCHDVSTDVLCKALDATASKYDSYR